MKANRILTMVATIGLAQWFFGNFYEELVLAPNMLVDSYSQLACWQNYFTVTNQIYYYVPFTQIAVFIVWYLFLFVRQRDKQIRKILLQASSYGFAALVLTVIIVTQLNLKLFFGDIEEYKSELYTLSLTWLILNGVRIYLVGAALYYTFKSYLLLRSENQP